MHTASHPVTLAPRRHTRPAMPRPAATVIPLRSVVHFFPADFPGALCGSTTGTRAEGLSTGDCPRCDEQLLRLRAATAVREAAHRESARIAALGEDDSAELAWLVMSMGDRFEAESLATLEAEALTR